MKFAFVLSNLSKKDLLNFLTALLATGIICTGIILSRVEFNPVAPVSCDSNTPLSSDCFLAYAREIGLDETSFGSCLQDKAINDRLTLESEQNSASKVFSAPSVVLAIEQDGSVRGFLLGNLLGLENISALLGEAVAGDIETAQRYWIQARLGYLNDLRAEVKNFFSESQGGSYTGAELEEKVDTYMANTRSYAETESEIRQFLISTDRSTGNGEIMLIEFSDYECPFCGDFERDVMARLRQNYSDKVTFVFRHLPETELHPNALNAAIAAECAREQDNFIE